MNGWTAPSQVIFDLGMDKDIERLFDERGCVPDPSDCGCIGHRMPGVHHIAPCCDKPHMEEKR